MMAGFVSQIIIVALYIVTVAADSSDWDTRSSATMMRYNRTTKVIEIIPTPVWQRCKCDFSNCDCYIEYINYSNSTLLARFYYRVDPNIPKKTFSLTAYDNDQGVSVSVNLKDGYNCHTFKTTVFDKFCLRTYGRASYSDFNRICIQAGVIIRKDSVISAEMECIKAWPQGTAHMQPSSYENPNITHLNEHLYKLRYSSSPSLLPMSVLIFILATSIQLIL